MAKAEQEKAGEDANVIVVLNPWNHKRETPRGLLPGSEEAHIRGWGPTNL